MIDYSLLTNVWACQLANVITDTTTELVATILYTLYSVYKMLPDVVHVRVVILAHVIKK